MDGSNSLYINDPNNMLVNIETTEEDGERVYSIHTKFGEFNSYSGYLNLTSVEEADVELKSGRINANSYYNYNGEAFPEGDYTDIMTIDGAPLGYHWCYKSLKSPKISSGNISINKSIIVMDTPLPTPPEIPMIRNIRDLYNHFVK
jgi:hypothetical protein